MRTNQTHLIPNDLTRKAIEEAKKGKNMETVTLDGLIQEHYALIEPHSNLTKEDIKNIIEDEDLLYES